jgi:hypothetical protein
MAERTQQEEFRRRQATDEYLRSVVAEDRGSDQLRTARSLLESGAITPDEFDRMQRRVRAS